MSWDRRIKNPGKVVNRGDWLELVVLDIDKEKRRISLGMKQLKPDPWQELEAEYPPGSIIKGKVKNFTDFGMFVGIRNGIDGLVHVSEISWSRRKRVIADLYKKGTLIETLVLNIDRGQKKFSLSIKRLKEDPWRGLISRHHVGDVVEGYITSITDFGVFVEIEDGIEGLIHLSEMDDLQGKHPSDLFKVDDRVGTAILNIDEKDKRIGLSIKALRKKEENTTIETLSNEEGVFSTLGDILEPAIKINNKDSAT
jgi:small subunit ribosomal protein S1